MDYTAYTLEDFLADERFVNYCFQTNEADVHHWEGVLANQPNLADGISKAKEFCLLLAVKVDEGDKRLALDRLKEAIGQQERTNTTHQDNVRTLSGGKKWWLSVAASLLLLACTYVLLTRDTPVERAIAYALEQRQPPAFAATTIDERKKITLPDGTTALLNSTSQLRMAADFNEKHRVVWLVGEAYFDVAKDKNKPFIVRTSSTVTTALGTSFKVKNYANQREPYVMLTSGSVQVSHIDARQHTLATTILQPGQRAILTEGEQLRLSSFERNEMTEWFDRKLEFQAAGFDEIKTKLCNIYGVSLVADESIAQSVAFTGQFVNRQLAEVLDAIAFSNRVQFTIGGNEITMAKYD